MLALHSYIYIKYKQATHLTRWINTIKIQRGKKRRNCFMLYCISFSELTAYTCFHKYTVSCIRLWIDFVSYKIQYTSYSIPSLCKQLHKAVIQKKKHCLTEVTGYVRVSLCVCVRQCFFSFPRWIFENALLDPYTPLYLCLLSHFLSLSLYLRHTSNCVSTLALWKLFFCLSPSTTSVRRGIQYTVFSSQHLFHIIRSTSQHQFTG